jgi:hypothetical protein
MKPNLFADLLSGVQQGGEYLGEREGPVDIRGTAGAKRKTRARKRATKAG